MDKHKRIVDILTSIIFEPSPISSGLDNFTEPSKEIISKM